MEEYRAIKEQLHGFFISALGEGEGEILSRTVHEGPEGDQMYSSTLSSTSALDGGGWSTPSPGRFTPRKDPLYRRLGVPQGRSVRVWKISHPPGFDPRTVSALDR